MAIFNSKLLVYQRVQCAPDRGIETGQGTCEVDLQTFSSSEHMLKKVQDWNEVKTWKTTRDVLRDVVCVRYKV